MTVNSQLRKTRASLKGVQATLRTYSAQSQHADSKAAFKEALESVNEVLTDIEDRIRYLEFEEPQYQGK